MIELVLMFVVLGQTLLPTQLGRHTSKSPLTLLLLALAVRGLDRDLLSAHLLTQNVLSVDDTKASWERTIFHGSVHLATRRIRV